MSGGESVGFSEAQKSYYKSREGKRLLSRGIPSKEAFWLPSHDKVKDILKKSLNPFDEFGVEWTIENLMQFVFPRQYRETQHDVATRLLEFVAANGGEVDYHEIGGFVARNGVSKATFYNKVVPRLIDVGMLERHRGSESDKGPMRLALSQTFHNYLFKMSKEWRRIVLTARSGGT